MLDIITTSKIYLYVYLLDPLKPSGDIGSVQLSLEVRPSVGLDPGLPAASA